MMSSIEMLRLAAARGRGICRMLRSTKICAVGDVPVPQRRGSRPRARSSAAGRSEVRVAGSSPGLSTSARQPLRSSVDIHRLARTQILDRGLARRRPTRARRPVPAVLLARDSLDLRGGATSGRPTPVTGVGRRRGLLMLLRHGIRARGGRTVDQITRMAMNCRRTGGRGVARRRSSARRLRQPNAAGAVLAGAAWHLPRARANYSTLNATTVFLKKVGT